MDSFFFEVSNYSVNMYNFNISMCLSKATFSSLQTIKVTFLILHHFPVVVLPLCLPVVLCREPARRTCQRFGTELRSWGAMAEPWGSYNRETQNEKCHFYKFQTRKNSFWSFSTSWSIDLFLYTLNVLVCVFSVFFLQFLVFICKVEVQWGRKGETQLGRDNRGSQQRKTNIQQTCKMVKKTPFVTKIIKGQTL